MARLISFAVLIAIIVFIGLLFYKVLIGFFIPVFLATVLVVVFRPLHRWVLEMTGQRERVSAAITTLLILLTMLLPIAVVSTVSAMQGLRLLEQNDAQTVALRFSQLRASLGLHMPPYVEQLNVISEEIDDIAKNTADSVVSDENAKLRQIGERTTQTLLHTKAAVHAETPGVFDARFDELIELSEQVGQPSEEDFGAAKLAVDLRAKFSALRTALLGGTAMAFLRDAVNPDREKVKSYIDHAITYVRPRLLSLTGATGSFIAKLIFGTVIMIVTVFFFLVDGPAMLRSIMHLSPLDDTYEQELLLEFDRISRAVVMATILSAVAQGLTAGIGFYFAGMEYLALLVMLTTTFAMVPFVGPAIIWIPVCVYLAMNDHMWTAGLLAAWGVLVVGTIDNVVKAVVLHGQSQLHPLLALLSVLGGVQSLGPIGIVVGPMVVAMLQTLLSILQRELINLDRDKFVLSTAAATGSPATAAAGSPADFAPPPAANTQPIAVDLASGRQPIGSPPTSDASDA